MSLILVTFPSEIVPQCHRSTRVDILQPVLKKLKCSSYDESKKTDPTEDHEDKYWEVPPERFA